jgi:ABC-type polysaccharide/polyol phosphate transport system ATPase subunit
VTPSALKLDDVSVNFRLHYESSGTLKEAFLTRLKNKPRFRELWALKNVSLSIGKGESVGIVGRNGSGKSTLLKIIAGVYTPSSGSCDVDGTIAPLIELGAGFNGELTGRENVYLNGAILGRSRAEMTERYASIVEFSELGDFMDVPVKNYSSGMYARLGFAIATDVDADILVIDEILGVGDEVFQRRCATRIASHIEKGRTMIFVSHDADKVKELCTRAIVLRDGQKVFDGTSDGALAHYRSLYTGDAA